MKHLTKNGKTVTINLMEKLDPPECERSQGDLAVVFLDVETTGLNSYKDRVIQLCLRPVLLNRETYQVSAIAKSRVFHQDPGFPLSEEIVNLTNITDQDVSGQSIDWGSVHSMISKADFVVCHNASFDRAFVESEFRKNDLKSSETIWACSMSQIFWRSFCRPSRALEVLCAWSGFFYNSHQAANDVDAMITVVRQNGKMQELLETASVPDYRVFAMNSPRDKNSDLKSRKYRWDPNVSCWYKNFSSDKDSKAEIDWLSSWDDKVEPQVFEIDPKYRYLPDS